MSRSTPSWAQQLFAWLLSKISPAVHEYASPWTREAFAGVLQGPVKDVVEVGIGGGQNMHFYAEHPGITVTGIDPNNAFQEYSIKNAQKHGLGPGRFNWIQGSGEKLPLPDNCCDAVITTMVFCSVTDLDRCMAEVQRVLRPGGKFLFMEHIGAKPGSILRTIQQLINPLWKFTFENCNLDRNTLATIRQSGFADVKATEFGWGWRAVRIQPLLLPIMALARPLCIGVATASSFGHLKSVRVAPNPSGVAFTEVQDMGKGQKAVCKLDGRKQDPQNQPQAKLTAQPDTIQFFSGMDFKNPAVKPSEPNGASDSPSKCQHPQPDQGTTLQREQPEVFEEEDFPTDAHKAWGLSDGDYAKLNFLMIGQPVSPRIFNDEESRMAGYRSWRAYEAHSAIRAW
ncbi:hypothetical protein WJX74_003361 [Apatococcus lobatus]|uniref:Methyltransferase type 11 domain-containing protein n=1 Tax=Apatococcus lobatus TaxID=904363 RepID=A0AAW1QLF7_9CHLO